MKQVNYQKLLLILIILLFFVFLIYVSTNKITNNMYSTKSNNNNTFSINKLNNNQNKNQILTPSIINTPNSKERIIGAFSITSKNSIEEASKLGINTGFYYGNIKSGSTLHDSLLQQNINKIDGTIWNYIYEYECYRLWFILDNPSNEYCTKEQALNAKLTTKKSVIDQTISYLESESIINDPLIIGYWILDDWPATRYIKSKGLVPWDPGSAQDLLIEINKLIKENNNKYNLSRHSFCGFAAHFGYQGGNRLDNWTNLLAKNFHPDGCDVVGIYSYTLTNQPEKNSDKYLWDISKLYKKVLTDLKNNGFDENKHKILGIVQTFGKPPFRVIPNANNIELESKSFCENGVDGIVFFAYEITSLPGNINPSNSQDISEGMNRGIKACKKIWNSNN